MNLLISGRQADYYIVKTAQEMGHTVHFMCFLQKMADQDAVHELCQPDHWVPMATRYDMGLPLEEYRLWVRNTIDLYVQDHQIDAILPAASMDTLLVEMAWVNRKHSLPGIQPREAAVFDDKANYLPLLESAGVRVPKIYEVIEPAGEPTVTDLPYPVIAKPGRGSGGFGVYVVENEWKLNWFFGPSDRPQDFTDLARFYQDHDANGNPKTYLHCGFGGRYLVQEYLDGPCISLAGTARDGHLELELAYEIGVTPPPNCAEVSFSWPIKGTADRRGHSFPAAERCRADLEEALTFPDGAWMVDTILHGGELYVVDLAPRMSSSGTKMLYHTCRDRTRYCRNVINAILGGEYIPCEPEVETQYSVFPFPKGRLSNIRYPSHYHLAEAEMPLSGEGRVFEMRNDMQVSDRGWVVAEGDDARETVERFINGIQYDVE